MENEWVFLNDVCKNEQIYYRKYYKHKGSKEERESYFEKYGRDLEMHELSIAFKVVKFDKTTGKSIQTWVFEHEDFRVFEDLFGETSASQLEAFRRIEAFHKKLPYGHW